MSVENSRLSGFFRLTVAERRQIVAKQQNSAKSKSMHWQPMASYRKMLPTI